MQCISYKVGNAFGCVKMPKTHLKPLSAASLFTRGHHTSISKCFIYLCRIPFLTHTQRVCLLLRLNQESFANLNMFLVLSKKTSTGRLLMHKVHNRIPTRHQCNSQPADLSGQIFQTVLMLSCPVLC